MTKNGWGKVRKINGEQAMPILVTGGEGKLKQNLQQMDGSLNYILFTQPLRAPYREIFTSSRL
jgi:hypothetical protein